jgi:hypothetical protein
LSGRVTEVQAGYVVEALDAHRDTELEELRNCLRGTRRLVGICAANGFTNTDDVINLFNNNGKITRLVPVRPQDRYDYTAHDIPSE